MRRFEQEDTDSPFSDLVNKVKELEERIKELEGSEK